jgi:hypothetical protein
MNNDPSSTIRFKVIIYSKIADIIVIILLVIFFISFLAYDYETLGLDKAPVSLPPKHKQYFDLVPWIIFAVLVFDLYLKYLTLGNNLRLLFRHHWLDVVMAISIPILMPLKFMKITVKLFKGIKGTKFAYKLGHKVNKFLTAHKGKRTK